MKQYIGTKMVNMQPMTRQEYNDFRGWPLPADENGADEGYLVEYLDGGKPNTPHYAGYVSWSPKAQADAAYREASGMSFGLAIEALKLGKPVARAGWNGKGMFLWLNKGIVDGDMLGFRPGEHPLPDHRSTMDGVALGLFECGLTGTITRLPNINMRSASGSTVTGWLASQTDMLADDWTIVE